MLREELRPTDELVCIDEIQKLPVLMDEVHDLIESCPTRFLLTGSSARKLRRSHTSLMAGRARTLQLHPLTKHECRDQFSPHERLRFGFLPPVLNSLEPEEELKDYTGDYLREEIQAEALARNLTAFSRFLSVAAHSNGNLVNFESVASDAQVPSRTIREYFHLLEDTLMANLLPPIRTSLRRKSTSRRKFYFFDVGVANALARRTDFSDQGPEFGAAFEHFIFMELKAYLSYSRQDAELSFWRDPEGHEIDFMIGDSIGIEVKSSTLVTERHIKNFDAYPDPLKRRIVVSRDPVPRRLGKVDVLPWDHFLNELREGELLT